MILKDPKENLIINKKKINYIYSRNYYLKKIFSGNKHIRLNIIIYKKNKNKSNKGYISSCSLLKIIYYFPNFRNYFGIKYKQIWNMDNIFLDIIYIKEKYIYIFRKKYR